MRSHTTADLLDITEAPMSLVNALADEAPSVVCEDCDGKGCTSCFDLGWKYWMCLT